MNIDYENFIKFMLVFFRCLGFLILTPIFGRRDLPAQSKIGLSALLSYIVLPLIPAQSLNTNLWALAAVVLREVTVGLSMGYITLLVFSALHLAGQVIDMEMGFGMVNVMDPQSNTQVPMMGNFYYLLSLILFLSCNGHHVLISAMIKSFEIVPLGKAVFGEHFLMGIMESFQDVFILGVRISMPIVAIIFLTDFALGIIARTVPQMNVFIVGLPLKIALGILGMIIILPMYLVTFEGIFNGTYESIFMILKGMWTGL